VIILALADWNLALNFVFFIVISDFLPNHFLPLFSSLWTFEVKHAQNAQKGKNTLS
jgi:hypothetical protein